MFKGSVEGRSTEELKYRQRGRRLCGKRTGNATGEGDGDLWGWGPLKQGWTGLRGTGVFESQILFGMQNKKIIRIYLGNIPLQCREHRVFRMEAEGHLGAIWCLGERW